MKKANQTFSSLLFDATAELSRNNTETASIDARLLLENASGLSHASLISNGNEIVLEEVRAKFQDFIERRISGEPVNRILGFREFFGREFILSPETLVPRDDTEVLVEAVLDAYKHESANCNFLEIGTGTGIIAVTLACEMPNAHLSATDISKEALQTASKNADALGVHTQIEFFKENLFEGLTGQYQAIISNPPYIPVDDIKDLSFEVREHDPLAALDGGLDGLDFYREIFKQARKHLLSEGKVFVEIGMGQSADVMKIASANGFENIVIKNDYSRIPRVIIAQVANS